MQAKGQNNCDKNHQTCMPGTQQFRETPKIRPDRRRSSSGARAETGTRTQRGAKRTGGRGCRSLQAGTERHPRGGR
ncbi:hypothetical protein NDU88_006534 [Pleurodeles waltl]|uniref:Uncharacterized protein n=1 Tax=Pleurodeles waltl TaxID=8319 RepID=A0AAV7PM43_PLEWA|nr:hypothetical protein NDU88_006534 [Pleurodeles waltl]